jgi:hypothetical protein
MDLQKQSHLRDLIRSKSKQMSSVAVGLVLTAVCLTALNSSCKSRSNRPVTRVKQITPLPLQENAGGMCESVCADTESNENWAVCYSCRCKEAMDRWLPSPQEVSCNGGREIPVYKATKTQAGITLDKITAATSECFNPPRFPEARKEGRGCNPGSKLGQLQRGSIWVKWICRRRNNSGNFFDPTHNYDDYRLIIFNERTGATCFFDDNDGFTNGTNNPDIDLTSGDSEKVRSFLTTYVRTEGSSCLGCHDNDPFLYSPYLKGAEWESSPSYTLGKYFAVHTKQAKKLPPKYLTSEKASPCLMCHRIGQGNTCRALSADSAGNPDIESMHAWVHGRSRNSAAKSSSGHIAPSGVVIDSNGRQWSFPAWMPPDMGEDEVARERWNTDYAEAVQTIQQCCERPESSGCTWSTIQNH